MLIINSRYVSIHDRLMALHAKRLEAVDRLKRGIEICSIGFHGIVVKLADKYSFKLAILSSNFKTGSNTSDSRKEVNAAITCSTI